MRGRIFMKKVAGWICIIGSVAVGVTLLVLWLAKVEMSSATVFLRAGFVLPIALIYGLRLVRGPTTVDGR
jgi:hypothetical protein